MREYLLCSRATEDLGCVELARATMEHIGSAANPKGEGQWPSQSHACEWLHAKISHGLSSNLRLAFV